MALCAPISFSLPVEEHIVLVPPTVEFGEECQQRFLREFQLLEGDWALLDGNPQAELEYKSLAEEMFGYAKHSDLVQYLQSHDDYDDMELARLIEQAEFIPIHTLGSLGVSLAEMCILNGHTNAFNALRNHEDLESFEGTKRRSILEVAADCDLSMSTNNLPFDHACAQLSPQDVFIGITLLDLTLYELDWRDYVNTPQAIARVEEVEAKMFIPRIAKL